MMQKKQFAPLYQLDRQSLFGASRNEFKMNRFTDSLWLHRINTLFHYLNIDKPVGFWDFVGKLLDYREWAAESHYPLHEISFPMPDIRCPEWLNLFPEHHRAMYNDSSLRGETAFLCEASDCYLGKFVFYMNQSTPHDEHFRLFSNKLNCMFEASTKPYLSSHPDGFPYIRHVSDDLNYALFDLSCFNVEAFEMDEPCIFMGSRQNYGHWFMDFFPKLCIRHFRK